MILCTKYKGENCLKSNYSKITYYSRKTSSPLTFTESIFACPSAVFTLSASESSSQANLLLAAHSSCFHRISNKCLCTTALAAWHRKEEITQHLSTPPCFVGPPCLRSTPIGTLFSTPFPDPPSLVFYWS